MNPRKVLWLTRILMLIGAALCVLTFLPKTVLPIPGSWVLLAGMVIIFVGLAVYLVNYRCPHCGAPLSVELKFNLLLPKKCPRCGEDL